MLKVKTLMCTKLCWTTYVRVLTQLYYRYEELHKMSVVATPRTYSHLVVLLLDYQSTLIKFNIQLICTCQCLILPPPYFLPLFWTVCFASSILSNSFRATFFPAL